ncbi:MAG TPA: beta-ketoacyl-ACP synthase III [Myxococcota bacterium]|nr:beta-ketoacyl-ACP synthase III [Myxococcota bacterium]
MRTKITGTGGFLPKRVITNDDLAKTLDTSDEWINTRTGIRQRQLADYQGDESCSRMGLKAALRALAMANLAPSELDLIITATITPDFRLPTVSCLIQKELGAINVPAFDLAAACAGSLYALSIADGFIRSGTYKNILVIASEAMSSIVNWQDRNTAVLFGDGASAAVVSANSISDSGFMDIDLYADGRLKDIICIPDGGSFSPIDTDKPRRDKIIMNGRETYKFAVRAVCEAVEKIIHDNQIDLRDIKFAVPHQANLRIIEAIAHRLDLPTDRFLINLDRCANTSAVSLLLAYDEANRKHLFKPGDLILLLAIGAGFVWGAGLYRV